MMRSAITISLVPEARNGPFVFQEGLRHGCARAAALGFDAVEIFPPSAAALPEPELRQLLKRRRLQLAAVGSGAGALIHGWTLTNPDASIRARAREFILEIIDRAALFQAPAIIGSMQGRIPEGLARKQVEQWLAVGLQALARHAMACGVPLLYEPLNRYETNLFNCVEPAAAFLERHKIRGVKLLCDLFHMNLEESSITAALRAVRRYVGHVHFADSNRQAMGHGHLDIKPVIRTLQEIDYQGYLSAEVLPLPTANAAAKQTMRAIRQLTKPAPTPDA